VKFIQNSVIRQSKHMCFNVFLYWKTHVSYIFHIPYTFSICVLIPAKNALIEWLQKDTTKYFQNSKMYVVSLVISVVSNFSVFLYWKTHVSYIFHIKKTVFYSLPVIRLLALEKEVDKATLKNPNKHYLYWF
jgi:hypothetical protein